MRSLLTTLCVMLVLATGMAAAGDDAIITNANRPTGVPSFLGYAPDKFIVVMNPLVTKLHTQKAANGVVHIGDDTFDAVSDRFAVSDLQRQFVGAERSTVPGAADLVRYYKIRFEDGTLEDAIAAYEALPLVERVEPIGIHSMYATPNDTYFSPYQWFHNATGDHDVDSPEAWDVETGSTSTIIALLDSGTRYYHPDLGGSTASPTNPSASRGNMWINNAELNGTAGVDDDSNGYVDDWIGYDFITGVSNCWTGEDCTTKDNDPRDFNGHGTHTAGIMGMLTNDGYGMAGMAGGWGSGSPAVNGNGCKIMPLRMGYSYNYLGQEYGVVMMDAAAEAFYYAADNGAKIASCSWGSSNTGGIGAAATAFINNGGIIFVAAGNDATQTADYLNGRGDCVSVSATDENDNGASFTTYGTWVDICAPGNNIYATYHDHTDPNTNYWAALSGTSMATPLTAAVAALIWSHNPSLTAAQVKTQLFTSADNIDAFLSSQYIGKMGSGRVNAFNAVNTGAPTPPVANFSGTPTSGTAPLLVNFTDLSTGSITSWAWTFGDGGTSTAQNPSHSYAAVGNYTVSLTVTGPGGSDGETKTNYISVTACTAPTAAFVGSPTSGNYPLGVTFTNQSTGGATSYSWNFGDGGTSTATSPSHTYTTAGSFTVTLTATNSCGSDQEIKTGYINVTAPPAQQCDDFADGSITNWVNSLGTWTATGGTMRGNSTTSNARRTSPFGSFGATTITTDIRMNTGRSQRNARIVFGWVNTNNYRFAEFDDLNNRVRIYERVGGTNTMRSTVNVSISTNVWYTVSVEIISGGMVNVRSGASLLTSYNFGNVVTGPVGVGYTNSNSYWDNFCVGTSGMASFAANEIGQPGLFDEASLPDAYWLNQNYPNPFNPTTEIEFNLPQAGHVSLEIYNVLGQRVATPANGHFEAGVHHVTWDASQNASGMYFYRLTTNEFSETKRMVLLK